MAPSKSIAQGLIEKADKKANSSTGWFSSASTKYEEAGDLYQQAANAFKLEKQFREAGDAFAREAECREKCSETTEAANSWWNAAKAYKQGYPDCACRSASLRVVHTNLIRVIHSGRSGAHSNNHPSHQVRPIPAGR
jgi:alpha-soluble NSF attachment protein